VNQSPSGGGGYRRMPPFRVLNQNLTDAQDHSKYPPQVMTEFAHKFGIYRQI